DRYVLTTEDEWVEATGPGLKLADSRGGGAIHDKDGRTRPPAILPRDLGRGRWDPRQGRLARRAGDLPAATRRGQPVGSRLGVDPARAARRRRCAVAPLR